MVKISISVGETELMVLRQKYKGMNTSAMFQHLMGKDIDDYDLEAAVPAIIDMLKRRIHEGS